MTTYAKLPIGALIEYKSAHSYEQAWVLRHDGAGFSEGIIKIWVKGETGINTDLQFHIYVKARGKAKIIELPEGVTVDDAPAEKPAPDAEKHARATGSHAACAHPATKSARAACRKARASA